MHVVSAPGSSPGVVQRVTTAPGMPATGCIPAHRDLVGSSTPGWPRSRAVHRRPQPGRSSPRVGVPRGVDEVDLDAVVSQRATARPTGGAGPPRRSRTVKFALGDGRPGQHLGRQGPRSRVVLAPRATEPLQSAARPSDGRRRPRPESSLCRPWHLSCSGSVRGVAQQGRVKRFSPQLCRPAGSGQVSSERSEPSLWSGVRRLFGAGLRACRRSTEPIGIEHIWRAAGRYARRILSHAIAMNRGDRRPGPCSWVNHPA